MSPSTRSNVIFAVCAVVVFTVVCVAMTWGLRRIDHIDYLQERCEATGGTWVGNYTDHECLRGDSSNG